MIILRITVWLIGFIIGSFIGCFFATWITEGQDVAVDCMKDLFSTIFRRGE